MANPIRPVHDTHLHQLIDPGERAQARYAPHQITQDDIHRAQPDAGCQDHNPHHNTQRVQHTVDLLKIFGGKNF